VYIYKVGVIVEVSLDGKTKFDGRIIRKNSDTNFDIESLKGKEEFNSVPSNKIVLKKTQRAGLPMLV
jgi:hypothetical protein